MKVIYNLYYKTYNQQKYKKIRLFIGVIGQGEQAINFPAFFKKKY